ncbi:MAG: HEPN domain-containing protein [Candidatus Bathyarchaeia archaeon]
MDSKEAHTYLEIAEDQLKDAELALRGERYALCALLSASCAENAASALITTLGAKPSKRHRNSLVLNRLLLRATPKLKPGLRGMIESLKALEPHITKARYPIRRGLELLPPSRFYTKEIAEKALAQAKDVVENVKPLTKS